MSKRYLSIDSSDDSDDESLAELEARVARIRAKRARKNGSAGQEAFTIPLDENKTTKLEIITDPADCRLQQLLWELNCDFELFPHQFAGVRALAGVSVDFPEVDMLPDSQDKNVNIKARLKALETAKPRLEGEDRGLILADVMGLGKTVQAVSAVRLVNAMARAKGESLKPTLIVSPNDAVMGQWEEHLVKAGVDPEKIVRFATKQKQSFPRKDIILLCTRYDLQTEARYILESYASNDKQRPMKISRKGLKKSPLFPNSHERLLKVLENQYKSNNCQVKNQFNAMFGEEKLSIDEVIVKYLSREERRLSSGGQDKIFQMVIIDEAHFLRNLKTYWGMAAGLVGLHSQRVILLTGTPFNNSVQDIATLQTFIKPSDNAAKLEWWQKVTEARTGPKVKALASNWSSRYLLRREKNTIAHLLPNKIVQKVDVNEINLTKYNEFEELMIEALSRVHRIAESDDNRGLKEAMAVVLGCASCMQLSLLSDILPKGGRQLTVLFSPSLRSNKKVKTSLENKLKCVCCNRWVKLAHKKKSKAAEAALDLDDLKDEEEFDDLNGSLGGQEDLERNCTSDSDRNLFLYESDDEKQGSNDCKGFGDIIPVGSERCHFTTEGIRHFACESCVEELIEKDEKCPMCNDLFGRLLCNKAKQKSDATDKEQVYCQDVHGGFVPSAKLKNILNDFKTDVPNDDKVAIFSFFKGSLDMLEAMFHEHSIETARFDGDFEAKERQLQLERFKTKPSCRVLLMTAQTGGTGLNIVEANHCWFTERYWNPMVLEQCEDRTFRIGQKKDCDIRYYDVPLTIDDIMGFVNIGKKDNAAIVLSDSVALQDNRVNYKDLSGFLSSAMSTLRSARMAGKEVSVQRELDGLVSGMIDSNEHVPSFLREQTRVQSLENIGLFDAEAQLPDDYCVFQASWKCGYCHTFNQSDETNCDCCGVLRPAPAPTQATGNHSLVADKTDWICGECLYANIEEEVICGNCATSRDIEVIDLSYD